MNATEIKQYIEENGDDPEVQTLVNSLADKRVNQARQKWETELPERIDTAIAERDQREQSQRERRIQVSEQLGELFAEARIQPDWAEPFLPPDLAAIGDDQIPEIAESVTAKVNDLRERLLNDRFSAPPIKGGGASTQKDPEAAEFRKAMGLN